MMSDQKTPLQDLPRKTSGAAPVTHAPTPGTHTPAAKPTPHARMPGVGRTTRPPGASRAVTRRR